MKTITLKMEGYIVRGVSDLTHWGGGNACIEMEKFHVQKINKKVLLENINDNGFGVQSINGAICDIYENYEGREVFLKTTVVGKVSAHTKKYYENLTGGFIS